MFLTNDKQLIARHFSLAAKHYDQSATLQRQTGHRLLQYLQDFYWQNNAQPFSFQPKMVADIGAGSGYFSHFMQQTGADVMALDLAKGMLQHIQQHQCAQLSILADAENLPLSDNSIDLCFSNLMVQWCGNLSQTIAEMRRVTRRGGYIAIATLNEKSLWQLRKAWQAADQEPHVNHFLSEYEIKKTFLPFKNVQIHTEVYCQKFENLNNLLQSLKNIGANHVLGRKKGLMGKQRWQRFQAAYDSMSDDLKQLPLDYSISYIIIENH